MSPQVNESALDVFLKSKGLLPQTASYSKKVRDIRPVARINPDRTESTVLLEQMDNFAYPTLFPKDPANPTPNPEDWIELSGREAFSLAEKRGEVFKFETEEEARRFAEGSWKTAQTQRGSSLTPQVNFDDTLDRFLEFKGYDIVGKLPAVAPEPRPEPIRPVPVTDPRAPTREQVAAGIDLLTPGPEIPTPEARPQELIDRPADYVPPPSWWQQVKDVAFLVKNGDLNAFSVASRGLLNNLTLGNVDPIKMVEKISGQEGFAKAYIEEEDRRLKGRLGYVPTVGKKALLGVGGLVGALVPLTKILKGAGAVVKGASKIPALQALARAELTGAAVGLAAKPEEEGVLNRIKQIPSHVLFFTAFEGLNLSAQQILRMVRYNRAAKFYKNVDWNAIPDPPGGETYTAEQMRELFIKFRRNIDPATKLPEGITPEEERILEFFKETGAWKEAAKQGWIPPEGFSPEIPRPETGVPAGLPRRPRFTDIFKRPPFAPFEPGFEPPETRPRQPSRAGAPFVEPTPPPPTPEPTPTRPQPTPEPRPTARPTPTPRRGAPAVVVDVTPKPEGGWTYNFKIPTVGVEPPPAVVIPWKPGATPRALPEPQPVVPGEVAAAIPPRVERKAKVFQNPLYEFINFHFKGVKPNPDFSYQALKQVLPFDLIRKDGSPLDVVAQAMSAEFPNIEGDADLMNALEKMADAKAATRFRDTTTGEEFVPPQEFFDEQLDESILDAIAAGREAGLSPPEIERARELLDLLPAEEAEQLTLDEGMAKLREAVQKQRVVAAEEFPEAPAEEFKLKREEEIKPKKPEPKKVQPLLVEKPTKAKAKFPEGFNELGWKTVPKYQGTLTAARKTAAAGFDVEYGPLGKGDEGYIHITKTTPAGEKGKVALKSRTIIPKDLKTPAQQLGLDDEVTGDLFAKAAPRIQEQNLVSTLNKLNVPAEHRGEVSLSVLKNFDPKKGELANYIRRALSNIKKKTTLKPKPEIPREVPSKERGPSIRFAEARAEVDILEAIERATKNKKEVEVVRRRILDEDSFEEIGQKMKISRQRAQKVFADTIVKMKKDPAVIKMLENRHKELHAGPVPKWKDITKIANTYFTSSKGMSKQIDAANDKRVQNPIADLFLTTLEGKEVSRWIQKNDNAGLRQQVKELLTGEMSFDSIALPENVPEVALKSLRKRIDDLSTLIMAHGGLKEPTLAAFESGIGKYLGTFYRLHEYNELNKGRLVKQYWDPPQEARDRFAARLRADDPGGFADFTDEMMDNFLDSMLRGEDYIYKGSNRTKRVPTEHYKSQKGVSKEYEEFAGIITDPVWLALRTVTKQTSMAYNAQFLNTLEDNPETAKMITHDLKTARSRGWQGNQLPDDYSYGRLRGAWVHPELNKFIRGEINPQMSTTERMIMKFVMNPFKATKTIWSVPTHARNVTGGVMFSFLMQTSIFNPLNAPYYWEIFRIWGGRKGKFRNEWAELIRNGVTETQFFKSEIPDLYNELLRLDPPDWPEKIFSWAARKPANALGELYNFEDVLYRGAAYLKQIKHFKKTPQEAVDLVNLSSPNYRKVPIAVEWLRRYPALGPFISFRFNVARILANNAIQAGKEISSKDPKKKIEGWLRIYRLAFIIGFPLLLAKISAKVFDVDEKKAKELEKTYPSYKRGGTIVYFRGEEGQLKGYDFTYTYPTGDITKAINNLFSGDTDSFSEDVQLFAHPIFDAYSILVKGEDPYWRTPIKDPLMRRVTELVKLLWLPQSAPIPSIQGLIEGIKTGDIGENLRVGKLTTYQIESLIQAYQKQEDRYGRVRKLPEELKNFFTGVRTWDVNPDILIAQYIKQKKFAIEDAEKTYENWLKRNTKAAYWQEEEQEALLERKRAKIEADILRVGELLESMDPTFHLRKSGRFK